MPRFNIALLPIDKNLRLLFRQIAETYFAACQDGYLLAQDAWAHVTLCQFDDENERAAMDAFHALANKGDEDLSVEEFRLRDGVGDHSGFFWAEFLVTKTHGLMTRQKECCLHLAERGMKSLVPCETYSPHLTLARVTHKPDKIPALADIRQRDTINFRLALGLCTENGVFVRELQP